MCVKECHTQQQRRRGAYSTFMHAWWRAKWKTKHHNLISFVFLSWLPRFLSEVFSVNASAIALMSLSSSSLYRRVRFCRVLDRKAAAQFLKMSSFCSTCVFKKRAVIQLRDSISELPSDRQGEWAPGRRRATDDADIYNLGFPLDSAFFWVLQARKPTQRYGVFAKSDGHRTAPLSKAFVFLC